MSPRSRTGRTHPARRLIILSAITLIVVAVFLFAMLRGSFEYSVNLRLTMLGGILVAAFTQGVGTIVFQTITENRILTPSIIGFDSMYTLMQTLTVFLFGGTVISATEGIPKLLVQTALMVLFATLLYRWLFSGKFGNLFILLLVGVVLGMAFDSLSAFLQRLLSPTDYDLLSVKLFGRISAVNASYLPLAFAICAVIGIVLWRHRFRLDVLLLGRDQATSIGVNHRRELTLMLVLIAIMIAFSTALVGPLTFYGFIVAMLAYEFAGTSEHRFVMPTAFLLGIITLCGAQFILQNVFYAGGLVTVIIEFIGGILFLIILLRKGTVS